jgi:hypothetical protein
LPAYLREADGTIKIKYLDESTKLQPNVDLSKFYFTLNFKDSYVMKEVVIWEKANSIKPSLTNEPVFLSQLSRPLINLYLSNYSIDKIKNNISATTPFVYDSIGRKLEKTGNPLPYAPLGVDSPRTFAYKMMQQRYASYKLEKNPPLYPFYIRSTLAKPEWERTENYYEHYANEIKINALPDWNCQLEMKDDYTYANIPSNMNFNNLKPFLPGFGLNNPEGCILYPESLFNPEKSAGVDSMGLLEGAIAMSKLSDRFLSHNNTFFGKQRDRYFKMEDNNETPFVEHDDVNYKAPAPGTPAFNMPLLYKARDYKPGIGKLTMLDIERCSVLVPDISEIQKGDILMKYIASEGELEPHVGIVVGFGWQADKSKGPKFGDSAKQWWNEVYVVSVRRSFNKVTLGTWGNPDGSFGGFAENPEEYQLRRLMILRDETQNPVIHPYVSEYAELIDTVYSKLDYTYPSSKEIPLDIAYQPSIADDISAHCCPV